MVRFPGPPPASIVILPGVRVRPHRRSEVGDGVSKAVEPDPHATENSGIAAAQTRLTRLMMNPRDLFNPGYPVCDEPVCRRCRRESTPHPVCIEIPVSVS